MSFTIRYKEDLLLFRDWFRELIRLHFSESSFWAGVKYPIEVRSHVRMLDNTEVDLMISNGKVVVIVELKECDIQKAIEQALERRRFADYIYVSLDLHTYTILKMLRNYDQALKAGIGFISAKDECIVIRAYPQRRQRCK